MLSLSLHAVMGFVIGDGSEGSDGKSSQKMHSEISTIQMRQSVRSLESAENFPEFVVFKDNKLDQQVQDRTTHQVPFIQRGTEGSSVLPIVLPSKLYYFHSDELTAKPVILQDVSPTQNSLLTVLAAQSIILRLLVNEHGDIDQVLIEDPHLSEEATQVVIDAFSKIKFHPGAINDQPVKSQLTIEVTLDVAHSNALPARSVGNGF